MKNPIDYYLQPFYLGEWGPRHVKKSSPILLANLSKLFINRNEIVISRGITYQGLVSRKTAVPFVRKKNVQKICKP